MTLSTMSYITSFRDLSYCSILLSVRYCVARWSSSHFVRLREASLLFRDEVDEAETGDGPFAEAGWLKSRALPKRP